VLELVWPSFVAPRTFVAKGFAPDLVSATAVVAGPRMFVEREFVTGRVLLLLEARHMSAVQELAVGIAAMALAAP
jgi:hypothetical protein